jgi:hypothetical protein
MDPKKIAKKAKSNRFDMNNSAMGLFHIMANCGGLIGVLTRNMTEGVEEIELADSEEEAFLFLKFLPKDTQAKLKEQAEQLVVATFITNEGYHNQHWHLVIDSYRKMRIKTIIKHIPQEELTKSHRKKDSVTTFHTKR